MIKYAIFASNGDILECFNTREEAEKELKANFLKYSIDCYIDSYQEG